ncbi:MAG: hypothetical protein HDR87_10185 [Bacteroides sp.]|nr:hypothetical protein [Bacteroides sp.]MBD5361058.1 hypothetical protein [Bacteroides sp.]
MVEIKAKRLWTLGISLVNALRVPYTAFEGEKEIGVIYLNPITSDLYPESEVFLKKTWL